MSPAQKSILSAGAIVLACGAVVAGTISRDKADLHTSSISPFAQSSHSMIAFLSDKNPGASASDFYEVVSDLLKRDYVDPITDERKLSTGAVRGMITSLDNPDCTFMDPAEFKAFNDAQDGHFQGIGVQLALEIPTSKDLLAAEKSSSATAGAKDSAPASAPAATAQEIGHVPALIVATVVPGSPAERAGVKVGDTVESVEGHWVMNPYDLEAFRRTQLAVRTDSSLMPKLLEMRRQLRKEVSDAMMPLKARDKICMGTSGTIKVSWNREGAIVPTTISKATTTEEAASKGANGIELHFLPGAASRLKTVLGSGPITIDLRNNRTGNFAEMKACLALLAPAGTYGEFVNFKGKNSKPFTITGGSKSRDVTLIVDKSTGGPAEMFALALKSKGAKLKGGDMSADTDLVEVVKLPDGSGYTLATGKYQPITTRRAA